MLTQAFDMDAHVKAWGGNKQLIAGGANDEFRGLPALGSIWSFQVTRDVTMGSVKGEPVPYPTYRLTLFYDDEKLGWVPKARGKIDKTMYGEAGVCELARVMKEKHCPTTRRRSAGVPTDQTGRRALIARLTTLSERPKPESD